MTGFSSDSTAFPHAGFDVLSSGPPPRDLWRRVRGVSPATLLLVGLLLGGGVGAGAVLASSDPTTSSEYQSLKGKLKTTEAQVAEQKSRADAAERAAAAAAAQVREAREALIAGQALGELRKAAHPG
jgi:hypothetical protein